MREHEGLKAGRMAHITESQVCMRQLQLRNKHTCTNGTQPRLHDSLTYGYCLKWQPAKGLGVGQAGEEASPTLTGSRHSLGLSLLIFEEKTAFSFSCSIPRLLSNIQVVRSNLKLFISDVCC